MKFYNPFKRRKDPRQYASDYLYLLDHGYDLYHTANERAMRVAAVYACVDTIASPIAGMPVRVKDTDNNVDMDHPAVDLLKNPASWINGLDFRKTMTCQLCLRGNAYARIIRTARGAIRSLIPIDASRVKVSQNMDGTLKYEVSGEKSYTVMQDEMFHLKGLSFDSICGLSILHLARMAYETSMSAEDFAMSLYKEKLHPGGLLMMPDGKKLTKGEYKRLQDNWSAQKGAGNQNKTMILEDGTTFMPLTMTAQDSQFIESRRFQRGEIAMFFGVPLHMINETEKVTSWGTGIEQMNLGFVDHTLKKYVDIWEAGLNSLYGGEVRFVHNMDDLKRGDMKTRWEAHVKGLQWGVLSPNEVRRMENMEPREGGDTYYDPPNTAGGMNENDNDQHQAAGGQSE